MSLLAQLAPLRDANAAQEATFFYLYAGATAFFIGLVLAIVTLIVSLRRKPSIEAEFPTKAEVGAQINQLRAEVHREIGGLKQLIANFDARNEQIAKDIFVKLDSMTRAFSASVTDIHRALGRLEGPPK